MSANSYTNRRELLAGLGGLAAGAMLAPGRLDAASLEPPGPPGPTMLSLSQIEPRTIVNEVNTPGNAEALFVISKSGSYYLAENVALPDGKIGILIDADDVTLDLGGFAMLGTANLTSAGGIRCGDGGRRRITVRNGNIGRAGAYAIDLAHDGGMQSRVRDIVTSMSVVGIRVGSGSLVFDCAALEAGDPGIDVGDESIVSRCRVHLPGGWPLAPLAISVGNSVIVSQCSTLGPCEKGIAGGKTLKVHGCLVDSLTAIAISAGAGSMFTECVAGGCKGDGIRLDSESLVRGNRIRMTDVVMGVAGIRAKGWRNVISDGDIFVPAYDGKTMMHLEGALNLAMRNVLRAEAEVPLLAAAGNAWSIIDGAASAFSGNTGGIELPTDNPDANIRH